MVEGQFCRARKPAHLATLASSMCDIENSSWKAGLSSLLMATDDLDQASRPRALLSLRMLFIASGSSPNLG